MTNEIVKERESQRNNSQKQGLNTYYDTKFISFNSNSEREWA